MMSTTPGPWRLERDVWVDSSINPEDWQLVISEIPSEGDIALTYDYERILAPSNVEEGDLVDDVRLMAASPILYAALQDALPILVWAASNHVTGARETLEAARAALASAGEEVG
jgi:hypothetical protein